MNTQIRPWVILALFNLAWMVPAWIWLDRTWWLWIAPLSLSINALLLTYDQVLNFRVIEGLAGHDTPIKGQDRWGLLKIIHELALAHNIAMPHAYVLQTDSAQIFSYGKRAGHVRLFVTEGLLRVLTAEQLRAILTFEIMKIKNGDPRVNYVVAAFLDLIERGATWIERGFRLLLGWTPRLRGLFLAPWILFFNFFFIRRRHYFFNDHSAAQSLQNSEDLAQALWRLESYAHTRPWFDTWTLAHMCPVNPIVKPRGIKAPRFQPNMAARLQRLSGRYPL